VIRFIAECKDHRVVGPDGRAGLRWGVEPMCAVLAEHGIEISPSTYYEQVAKAAPTRAQLREEQVAQLIRGEREHPGYGRFASTLGSRKM
jgi:putative transposase